VAIIYEILVLYDTLTVYKTTIIVSTIFKQLFFSKLYFASNFKYEYVVIWNMSHTANIKLQYMVIDGKITLHFLLSSKIRICGMDLSGIE